MAFLKFPFLFCMYATMMLCFFTLYQAIKLLGSIEKQNFFSELSIKILNNIKLSGIIMTGLLYVSGMPAAYLVAEVDNAPGGVIIGFAIASIPLVVATFITVFQRLLQEAIEMKSELKRNL